MPFRTSRLTPTLARDILLRPGVVEGFSSKAQSLMRPVLAAMIFHLIIVGLYLAAFRGDISVLVCAPQNWLGKEPFERVRTTAGTAGFDGAYYYVIAQNPLHPNEAFLDAPCYRRVRIFYPLVAWALSAGGNHALLLWVMPLLNLLAVGGLAWIGASFARHHGRTVWWGWLLPIAANAILPGLRDLTDPWSALGVVGVLAAWLQRWPVAYLAIWGCIAVLTREQNLAIVAIVAGFSLFERDWRRVAAAVAPIALESIWIGTLYANYGHLPRAADTLDLPLAGLGYGWTHLGVTGHGQPRNPLPHILRMNLLTAQVLICFRIAFWGPRGVNIFALAAACLASVAGQALFTDPSNYLRVLNWAAIALWIWAVQTDRRWPITLLATAAVWPLLEIIHVWKMHG